MPVSIGTIAGWAFLPTIVLPRAGAEEGDAELITVMPESVPGTIAGRAFGTEIVLPVPGTEEGICGIYI